MATVRLLPGERSAVVHRAWIGGPARLRVLGDLAGAVVEFIAVDVDRRPQSLASTLCEMDCAGVAVPRGASVHARVLGRVRRHRALAVSIEASPEP